MFGLPNINEELKRFVWWLWDTIQAYLSIPNSLFNTEFAKNLVGNSAGLSATIAFYVVVAMLIVAMIVRRKRTDGAVSVFVVVMIAGLIPVIYGVAEGLVKFGDSLKRLALLMEILPERGRGPSSALVDLPFIAITDTVLTFFFLLLLAIPSVALLVMIIAYPIATVVLVAIGAIGFALVGLGERSRKLFGDIISLFLLTGVIGLPVSLFFTQIGQSISDFFIGETSAAASVILLFIGALAGVAVQPKLYSFMRKRIDRVVGKMIAKVDNKLRTVPENSQRLEAHLRGGERTTMSYRFKQSFSSGLNSQIDKVDSWKAAKAAYVVKAISDASERYKSRGSQPLESGGELTAGAQRASDAIQSVGTVATVAVPHPAAKVAVGLGATALNALIQKVGTKPLPRARTRS